MNGQLNGRRVPDPNAELRGRAAEHEPDRIETKREWRMPDGSPVFNFKLDEQGRKVPDEIGAHLVEVEYTVPGVDRSAITPKPLHEAVTLPGFAHDEPALWDSEAQQAAMRNMDEILADLGIGNRSD